jgi:hypothetical protein
MDAAGYSPEMQSAARGVPVMGGGNRRQTPRARQSSPKRGVTFGGETVTPATKINIQKMG